MMRTSDEQEAAYALEPITDPPDVPELVAELPQAVDPRAEHARAIPPGEGGQTMSEEVPGEEPPAGEPPTAPPPAEAPPVEPAPVPVGDPSPTQAPVTEPPSEAPAVQATVTELEPTTAPPAMPGGGEYLEELSTPLEESSPGEPLAVGSELPAPAGPLRITAVEKVEAGVQHYRAETSNGEPVQLQEASGEATARMQAEAELLTAVHGPMLPRLLEQFELDGRHYTVTEVVEGRTLAEALAQEPLPFPQVVSVVAQAAYGVKQLHAAGWAHLGLRPGALHLGKPIKLTDLAYATRLGEKPAERFYHAGYSPPELLTGEPVDERADIYSLGALLFHAVNGAPIAETGVELSTWEPPRPIGGLPQILARCLGPKETRYSSVDQLHRDLLRLARRLAPPVRYSIAAATNIGLETSRTTNQDAFVWFTGSVASEEGLRDWAVLCVSDGMGGMASGEVASNAAVKRLSAEAGPALAGFTALTAEDQVRLVKEWMHAANDSATDAMERLRVRGGATLVCGLVVGRRLTISHVGDCRIYLLRGEEIRQLNRDHSLVMALALRGEISVEEIRHHPDRSTITRSLGDRRPLPQAYVDTLEQVTGQPTLELETGDVLLLCSDGLWEPVVEAQMQQAVAEHAPDLAAAADELVRLALEGGGPDNVTVMLFRVE